jgi:pyruvate/2-oxoglutarate/acetoin dehydrogenase E1 component
MTDVFYLALLYHLGRTASAGSLEAPVARIGAIDAPYPPYRYETLYLPDVDRILEAADVALAYG